MNGAQQGAELSERFISEPTFTAPLCCLKCQQTGFARYERNAGSSGRRLSASSPIHVSDGFYLRVNINRSFNMQIVCEKCGKVHRGPAR